VCRFVYFDGCPLSRDLHTGESYSTKEHFLVWKHLEVVEIYRHEEEIYCREGEEIICDTAKEGNQHISYVPPYRELSIC
jgi:hypothetical protein